MSIEQFAQQQAFLTDAEVVRARHHPAYHSGCDLCRRFEKYMAIKEIIRAWLRASVTDTEEKT